MAAGARARFPSDNGSGHAKLAQTSRLARALHRAYLVGLALKGIDGLIEISAGTMLLLTAKPTIIHIVELLTRPELAEHPHSFLALHAISIATGLSLSAQHFVSVYLVAHGAIKAGLVMGLVNGWRRAYPIALILLSALIGFQSYRLARYHSPVLAVFTIIDIAIVLLIVYEWRRYTGNRTLAQTDKANAV